VVFPGVCVVFVASSLKYFLCKKENVGKQSRIDCIAVHGSDWFHKGYCVRVGRFQTENFEIFLSNHVVQEKVTYICMQLWGTTVRLTQQ